jgi:hypothetical protein
VVNSDGNKTSPNYQPFVDKTVFCTVRQFKIWEAYQKAITLKHNQMFSSFSFDLVVYEEVQNFP